MLRIDRDGAHDFLANVRSVLSGEKVISNCTLDEAHKFYFFSYNHTAIAEGDTVFTITLERCRPTQDRFAHVNVLYAPWPVVYSQFAFWKQSRSTFHRHPILNTAYD